MALLLGGFAFNANAQVKSTKPSTSNTNTSTPSEEDIRFWNDLLDRYESAINEYQKSETAKSKVSDCQIEIEQNREDSQYNRYYSQQTTSTSIKGSKTTEHKTHPMTTEQNNRRVQLDRRYNQYKDEYEKKWDDELKEFKEAIDNERIQEAENIQNHIEKSKDLLYGYQKNRFESLKRDLERVKAKQSKATNVSETPNTTQQTTTTQTQQTTTNTQRSGSGTTPKINIGDHKLPNHPKKNKKN